jgi:hypothetical protein
VTTVTVNKSTFRLICLTFRDILNDDDICYVDALQDASQNAVCVIKLLLIVALRFGHVYGTTINEVLEHTAKRADRTVQWIYPKRPVLCKIPRGSAETTFNEPAPANQLSNTLVEMGLAAGVLDRITSHALRYGAIRDTVHIKKTVAGLQEHLAAMVAGHSNSSKHRGVTRMYIGGVQTTVYNLRAEEKFNDKLAPKFAVSPMKMRGNTTAEIDDYLEQHGLDKLDPVKRTFASTRLQEKQVSDWKETEKDRQVSKIRVALTQQSPSKLNKGPRQLYADKNGSQPKKHFSADLTKNGPMTSDRSTRRIINADQPSLHLDGVAAHPEKYFSTAPPIGPLLVALDDKSLVFNNPQYVIDDPATADKAAIWNTKATDDALIKAYLDECPVIAETQCSPLALKPDGFVDWFASVNVFKLATSFKQNDEEEAIKRVASGNSRNSPTPFLLSCIVPGLVEVDLV